MKRFLLSVLGIVAALSITVCGNVSGASNLFIGLTTDKQIYHSREPLAFALTVLNRDSRPYQALLSSGMKYDFILTDLSGKEVWKWSKGKMFTQVITKLNLEPGLPLTWVVVVGPKKIQPGKYRLTALFKTTERLFTTEPVEIEVRP